MTWVFISGHITELWRSDDSADYETLPCKASADRSKQVAGTGTPYKGHSLSVLVLKCHTIENPNFARLHSTKIALHYSTMDFCSEEPPSRAALGKFIKGKCVESKQERLLESLSVSLSMQRPTTVDSIMRLLKAGWSSSLHWTSAWYILNVQCAVKKTTIQMRIPPFLSP